MSDQKDTVIIDLKVVESGTPVPAATQQVTALSTSILGLQKSSKALRDERKLLDTSTVEGSKKIQEINKQIDANDKAIKANSTTLEKQRLNVGNYTGALDKLIPGLGSTIDGILGMTKASLAFIATPIGLILAALALALAAVAAYFKGSEEGADKFAKVAAQASAVLNVLVDRVIKLGGAIVAFLSGDFQGGLKKMEESFSGIGDEIEREVKAAGDLADAIDALEERELKYGVAAGETANQIKELVLQSKNRSKTEEERIALTQQAIELEKKQNDQNKSIQAEAIRIAAAQLQLRNNQFEVEQKAGESAIDFAKRLIDNDKILLSSRQELAELLDKYNSAQGDSIGIQEKVQNQQDALQDKLDARIAKEKELNAQVAEYIKKIREASIIDDERTAKQDAELQSRKAAGAAIVDVVNSEAEARIKATLDSNKLILAANDKFEKDSIKNKQDAQNIKAQVDQDGYKQTADLLNKATGLFAQNTLAFKVIATGKAIVNTYLAATAALASGSEETPIYGIISAALAIATGLENVAQINKVQFASGGEYDPGKYVHVGGRRHSQGGTTYVGEDGNGFEVEEGEGIYILKREAQSDKIRGLSSLNMAHGGNSFGSKGWYRAQGGAIETRSISNGQLPIGDIQRIIRTTIQSIPPSVVYVDDIAAKSNQVGQINKRARVI